MLSFDAIENLPLIENGLLHLEFELSRNEPSYFRVAREAHLILYRSMIEALKGSANFAVTGRPSRNRKCTYQMGRDPWMEILKVSMPMCKRAWRFSEPAPCAAPSLQSEDRQVEPADYLIGFYDALAMIQTNCFMGQFTHSKAVRVSDQEMKTLEWLHERIRNEYEHFVPKYYSAPVDDLCAAADVCLSLTCKLLCESGNVLFFAVPDQQIKTLLDRVRLQLEGVCAETMADAMDKISGERG